MKLIAARNDAERAARRFDRALTRVEDETQGLRASMRHAVPVMVGGGIAAGLLLLLLPRPLRRTLVFAVAPFMLRILMPTEGRDA